MKFWTEGYYISTVGQKGGEETISKYVQEQGKEAEFERLYSDVQLELF